MNPASRRWLMVGMLLALMVSLGLMLATGAARSDGVPDQGSGETAKVDSPADDTVQGWLILGPMNMRFP